MTVLINRRRLLVLGAVGGAALIAGRRLVSFNDGDVLELTGRSMATDYVVKIADGLDGARVRQLAAAVQAAFDGVDQSMSIFKPTSEVSRLNAAAAGAFELSPQLATVLGMAQRVSRWSHGAFDVTVKPLVQSWGFGTTRRFTRPNASELRALQAGVNWRDLQVAGDQAIKARAEMQVDLGGIAKGYGVDLAAAALESGGARNYMIELGGEVRTAGLNGARAPWQIGIEQPDAAARRPRMVVGLSGQAIATSGDYRIFFEQDGQRYSHEIDPATGAPITHGLASVTVVADDCMQADALATALIVMGPERGLQLAEVSGLAAHFMVRTADAGLHDYTTSAFDALEPKLA